MVEGAAVLPNSQSYVEQLSRVLPVAQVCPPAGTGDWKLPAGWRQLSVTPETGSSPETGFPSCGHHVGKMLQYQGSLKGNCSFIRRYSEPLKVPLWIKWTFCIQNLKTGSAELRFISEGLTASRAALWSCPLRVTFTSLEAGRFSLHWTVMLALLLWFYTDTENLLEHGVWDASQVSWWNVSQSHQLWQVRQVLRCDRISCSGSRQRAARSSCLLGERAFTRCL